MMEKTRLIFATLAGVTALYLDFIPASELPKGYFMLVRFIVCFVCVYMAWASFKAKSDGWTWLLGGCAALYNPFVPVHLSTNIWLVSNAFAILLIACACWQLSRKRVERPASPLQHHRASMTLLSSAEDTCSPKNHQINDNSHSEVSNPKQISSSNVNEPISKALELQIKKTEECKRTYKYFNYAFYIHIVCFILMFTFDKNIENDIFMGMWWVFWIGSGLAYIMFLGSLVGSANKSYIHWVGGTILFSYIGMFVSFVKMKNVAIEQGWIICSDAKQYGIDEDDLR